MGRLWLRGAVDQRELNLCLSSVGRRKFQDSVLLLIGSLQYSVLAGEFGEVWFLYSSGGRSQEKIPGAWGFPSPHCIQQNVEVPYRGTLSAIEGIPNVFCSFLIMYFS